jgi:hypothetical protein
MTAGNNAIADYTNNVGNLFEVIAKTEERVTGVFDACVNRAQAKALADAGYSLKPGQARVIGDRSPLDLIMTVEQEMTGTFRPALARQTEQALTEAGCSF